MTWAVRGVTLSNYESDPAAAARVHGETGSGKRKEAVVRSWTFISDAGLGVRASLSLL